MAVSRITKPTTYLKKNDFVVQNYSKTYDIGGNATVNLNFGTVSKSGYTALGIVSFYSGGQIFTVSLAQCRNNTADLCVHNTSANAFTGRTANMDVLFVKNV